MNIVIRTDRLLLRTFTEDDSFLIYELNLDPEVIRYTLDPVNDLAHAKKILDEVILTQYKLYGYGRWAVHLKSTLEFIGWCGLKFRSGRNEVDLGYRFQKKFWGNGYATESADACLKYGFEKLSLGEIIGRSLPENIGSIRVLEKCGIQYTGEEYIDGLLHKNYLAKAPFIKS